MEARICYEQAESLCQSLNRSHLLYSTLMGRWRYSLMTDKLTATLQVAERIYSMAEKQSEAALLLGAHSALTCTLYFLGDFQGALKNAIRGINIWRSEGMQSQVEELAAPYVEGLCYKALVECTSPKKTDTEICGFFSFIG